MNLALLIAALVASVVQSTPQISATIRQIVMDVYNSLSAVVASGAIDNPDAETVLKALAGVIAALKVDPSLPADKLGLVQALESAAAAALLADQAAQKVVDPSTLKPIDPLP
jgi:hypothetical protein